METLKRHFKAHEEYRRCCWGLFALRVSCHTQGKNTGVTEGLCLQVPTFYLGEQNRLWKDGPRFKLQWVGSILQVPKFYKR